MQAAQPSSTTMLSRASGAAAMLADSISASERQTTRPTTFRIMASSVRRASSRIDGRAYDETSKQQTQGDPN